MYQPEPTLYGLSIRMDPRLPLSTERVRLEAPEGGWSPFSYGRGDGGLHVDVEGLREHTTTVEFVLDAHGIDPERLQDTLPVTVDVDLRPSQLPITAVNGRAHFELPIRAMSSRR